MDVQDLHSDDPLTDAALLGLSYAFVVINMVTQKLVNEEAFAAVLLTSVIQESGEMEERILSEFPDATEEQIKKAVINVQQFLIKKSGYEQIGYVKLQG